MSNHFDRYTLILKIICEGYREDRVVIDDYVLQEFKIHKSELKQIRTRIEQLKSPPRIENGQLVCFECGRNEDVLVIHHDHKTGEQIAIICSSCNVLKGHEQRVFGRQYKSSLNYKKTEKIPVRVSKELKEIIRNTAKELNINMSTFLRLLVEISCKSNPIKNRIKRCIGIKPLSKKPLTPSEKPRNKKIKKIKTTTDLYIERLQKKKIEELTPIELRRLAMCDVYDWEKLNMPPPT